MCLYPFSLQAQGVSANFSSTPLATAIKSVCDKAGYRVSFSGEDMGQYTVTCSLNGSSVADAMSKVLAGKPYTFRVDGKQVIVSKKAAPQTPQSTKTSQVVKGKVVDETGEELIGANVILKGGDYKGTSTNMSGEFSMGLGKNKAYTLIISYLGYKEQTISIKPSDRDVVDLKTIKLTPDENTLDDVVVNGMFSRKTSTYTGAVVTLKGEELKGIGNTNILGSLKNVDPSFQLVENLQAGSNPNNMPNYQMRGQSGFSEVASEYKNNPNQPLFILDGFETTIEKVVDLNMDQIESVTLLKDATAKAMYGAKAANGVIVIETVKPEQGRLRITYNGSLDMEMPILSSYNLANAAEKLEVERRAGYYNTESVTGQFSLNEQYYQKYRDIENGASTNWLAQPVRTGVGHKHTLYFEGGDNAVLYGVDLMYNNVEGAMKGSDRNTLSGGVTLTYRVKNFNFRNKLSIDYNNSHESPYGSFSQYALMNPYNRIYDADGALNMIYTGLATERNPMADGLTDTNYESRYTTITENFYAEWNVLQNLKLIARFGFTSTGSTDDTYLPSDHTSFASYSGDDLYKKGSYTILNRKDNSISGDLGANYSVDFGKNQIFANAQMNWDRRTYDYYTLSAEGLPNSKLNHITQAVQYLGLKPTGSEGITQSMGFVASLNYSYDERYLLDANYRLTGSSDFGADNRWGHFWSTGIGWNLHREAFMESTQNWLSRFKIRLSTGYTGSQGFNSYDAVSTILYNTSTVYNGQLGAYVNSLANRALAWQKKYDNNFGIDFAFLKNALSGRFELYESTTKGTITSVTTPPSMGFDHYMANLGEVQNKGWEFYLSGRVWQQKSTASYVNLYANLSSNTNKLVKISNSLKTINDRVDSEYEKDASMTSIPVRYAEGSSLSTIWAVPSLGIDPQTGKEVFIKKDGTQTYKWSASDMVDCGDKTPNLTSTFGLNAEIKGVGVALGFLWQTGGQIYNTTLLDKVENADVRRNVDARVLEDRWTTPGQKALYKSALDNSTTQPTSRFVQDYSLLQLSNCNIYYDFKHCAFMKHCFLDKLKATFYMTDLFTWSNVKVERGTSYPYAKTFNFSIQAIF